MSFSTSRILWLHNGYGVEFVISEQYAIEFHIVTEQDQTLVDNSKVCIGSDSVIRAEDETPKDFAIRARIIGLAFAKEMIEEHNATLALSAILDEVVCKETE